MDEHRVIQTAPGHPVMFASDTLTVVCTFIWDYLF